MTVIPSLRYRDAHKANEFLVATFGFERKGVWLSPEGTVAHAELTFRNGMIMLGTVAANELAQHLIQPDEIGNRATSTPDLVITDPCTVYLTAKAQAHASCSC